MTIPSAPSLARPAAAEPRPSSESANAAAAQFEALLIAQMLKSSRQSGEGWLGGGGDASQTMTEFAEEQLASAIAQAGGLGLSSIASAGLLAGSGETELDPVAKK